MCGYGQRDDVGVADGLLGRESASTRSEDVDGQGDVVCGSGARDRDVVAGLDRGACECGAQLAGADYAEAQVRRLGPVGGVARLAVSYHAARRFVGGRDRFERHPQLLASEPTLMTSRSVGSVASRSRTRGMTSRPNSSIVAIRCWWGMRPMA